MPQRRGSYDVFRRASKSFQSMQQAHYGDEKARLSHFQHESRKRNNDCESQHDAVTPRTKKTRHSSAFEQAAELPFQRPHQLQPRDPSSHSRHQQAPKEASGNLRQQKTLLSKSKMDRLRRTTAQVDVEGNVEISVCPSSSFSTEDGSVKSKFSETNSKTSDLIAMWSKKTTQESRFGRHISTTREFVDSHIPAGDSSQDKVSTPRQSKLYGKSWQYPDRKQPEPTPTKATPNSKPYVHGEPSCQTPIEPPCFHPGSNGKTQTAKSGFRSALKVRTPRSKSGFKSASPGQTSNTKPGIHPTTAGKTPCAASSYQLPTSSSQMVPDPFQQQPVRKQPSRITSTEPVEATASTSIDPVSSGEGSSKSQLDPPIKRGLQITTPLKSKKEVEEKKLSKATPRSSSRGITGIRRPPMEQSGIRSEVWGKANVKSNQKLPSDAPSAPAPPPPPSDARVSRSRSRGRPSTGRASPSIDTPPKDEGNREQSRGRSTPPMKSPSAKDRSGRRNSRGSSINRTTPLPTLTPSEDQGSRLQSRDRSAGRDFPPLSSPPSKHPATRNQSRGRSMGRSSPQSITASSRDERSLNQSRGTSSCSATLPLTVAPSKDEAGRNQSRGKSNGRTALLSSPLSKDRGNRNQRRGRSIGPADPPLASSTSKDRSAHVRARSRLNGPKSQHSSTLPQDCPDQKYCPGTSPLPHKQVSMMFSREISSQGRSTTPTPRGDDPNNSDQAAPVPLTDSQDQNGTQTESHTRSTGRTQKTTGASQFMKRVNPNSRVGRGELEDESTHSKRQSLPVSSSIHLEHSSCDGSQHYSPNDISVSYGKIGNSMGADQSLLTSSIVDTYQECESKGSLKENSHSPINRSPSKPRQSIGKAKNLHPSSRRESRGLEGKHDRFDADDSTKTTDQEDEYHAISRLQYLERRRSRSRKSTGSMNNVYLSSGQSFLSIGRATPLLKGGDTKDASHKEGDQPKPSRGRARQSTGQIDPTGRNDIHAKRTRDSIDPATTSFEREKQERKRGKMSIQVITVSSSSSMEDVESLETPTIESVDSASGSVTCGNTSNDTKITMNKEVKNTAGAKENKSVEQQFSVDVLYPTYKQKQFGKTTHGYTIWCSYGHEKPTKYQAWNPPVKVFDTSYATLEAANNRAKYFFYWENAFGVDPERLAVICTNFTENDKQQCKYFECRAVGGGKTWKVAVVPTNAFEWMDRASIHRHSYGKGDTCDVKATLASDMISFAGTEMLSVD